MRYFPISLIFFVKTAVVYAAQHFPTVGIYLMFAGAALWSIFLVNAGMVGIVLEAAIGRIFRWWLVVPLAFYGGYWAIVVQQRLELRMLSASYETANAHVAIPFDPARQSLVFDNGESGAWLTEHYGMPVTYAANNNFPEGYLSHRIVDEATCDKIRQAPAMRAAFVHTSGFHDGDSIRTWRLVKRFCALSMPERPELPMVRVSRQEEKYHQGSMPVRRYTTTVTSPDGRHFQLLAGSVYPLTWWPMPVMGCMLNSASPSWDCAAGFRRVRITLVPGSVLTRALGLEKVDPSNRRGADPAPVLAKAAAMEDAVLERQLANIDAIIEDPARTRDWQTDVIRNRPDALESRAEAIMKGLERAAALAGNDRYVAGGNGRTLIHLVANLSKDRFVEFGPRILAIYAAAGERHWLWETTSLLGRLGDLGPAALPYLVDPKRNSRVFRFATIEGLCRVGAAGRSLSEPKLIAMWTNTRDRPNRDTLAAIYVAMRRIGIAPPPLAEDKYNRLAVLQGEWADISPQSPSRVCAVGAERRARREEERHGERRTNLE